MGIEIERKFLLRNDAWRQQADAGQEFRQGYLHSDASLAVRVRIADKTAWLTIKADAGDIVRREFEYAIPVVDADSMLTHLCRQPLIEKRRHRLEHAGHVWEIDVFHGANAGLVLAEIELSRIDEDFARPPWLGEEVSTDPRYFNSSLSQHPFREWGHEL